MRPEYNYGLGPIIGHKNHNDQIQGYAIYPAVVPDILEISEGVSNYFIELYTNSIGTDEILIHVGTEHKTERFPRRSLKTISGLRFRITPSVKFESAKYVNSLQSSLK